MNRRLFLGAAAAAAVASTGIATAAEPATGTIKIIGIAGSLRKGKSTYKAVELALASDRTVSPAIATDIIELSGLNLDPYIGLEHEATAITCYSTYYIPALLQTEDYAQTIIKAIAPKMDPAIHQQRVEVRMRRQQRLDDAHRPRYRVLLDESSLRRRVGGPALIAAQLSKILQTARSGKAVVQVVTFEAGAHAAADGNFVLLEFADSNLSPVIFIEGLTGNQYLERAADIARYREAVEYLRDAALSPRDSLSLITELKKAYENE